MFPSYFEVVVFNDVRTVHYDIGFGVYIFNPLNILKTDIEPYPSLRLYKAFLVWYNLGYSTFYFI